MNLSTIIVAGIVAIAFISIVVTNIKNKKKGKSSCGGGCSGCSLNGSCH